MSAKKGYKGSSKDHQYFSRGNNIGDSELICRAEVCGCDPCIAGRPFDCLIPRVVGRPHREKIVPAPAVERRQTRAGEAAGGSQSLVSFAESLKKNQVVAVRVHRLDLNPEQETFFDAKIVGKAWKLDKKELYGSNWYEKGWWVVRLCWFTFQREEGNGDRLYSLKSRGAGAVQVFSVNGLVQGLAAGRVVFAPYERRLKLYRLTHATDAYINKYGSFSS